jgi:hypothetical protein
VLVQLAPGQVATPLNWTDRLPTLLPLAAEWATAQSRWILAEGVPLTPDLVDVARRVGVRKPKDVRLLVVFAIPGPEHGELRAACDALGFLAADTAGLTLGSGIFLRQDVAGQHRLIAHELRHVAQYEEYPSIAAYLERYIPELLEFGYRDAPLEADARRMETAGASAVLHWNRPAKS